MEIEAPVAESPQLDGSKWIQVALLALYCAAAVLGPIYYLFVSFDPLFPGDPDARPNGQHVFAATVLMGVLGSALRGMSRLFHDVGHGDYNPSWSLSILMRPLEGAGIALVSYLALGAGIILLQQDPPDPNPSGYLFFGILSGMFSHRAADSLRGRFDDFWGRKPDEQSNQVDSAQSNETLNPEEKKEKKKEKGPGSIDRVNIE